MPQLVKGGKYVYGWSKVGDTGKIVIPPDAVEEYNLRDGEKVILIPGSSRSGGFGITTVERLQNSPLIRMVAPFLETDFTIPEGDVINIKGRPCCWVHFFKGCITVPEETLNQYGINLGDSVLSVRGSKTALGILVRGPIIEEARMHEIDIFE